ncbi:polysaccharide deacetylase family protein [Mangrovibrevibacter kandeliae]|uniref:polysaccharide deacetylase family protein n=1 Tax=Mangrovibrevibacter kandeliae TaxID=2968473 RepID=UPI0021191D58|nr:polysaccharide deacetylase family protein [Aurantimonas sp. CSK15Z-1]MCQ8781858.1 polysaccharide deacetylase family protein [Aurantimonas sp. CSK15Z-1]
MQPRSYGPFAYSPIVHRPRWTLPGNARVALWVIPNIEFFALDEQVPAAAGGGGLTPDVPTWSARDYGNRVGIFRMMKALDRFGIRGTVALNSDLCRHHPEILEEAGKRGWELMGHNESNTRRLNAVAPEEERGIVARTVQTIRDATGQQPVGWLGSGLQETWNTLEHLSAEGVRYVCDWTNDDQPYWMTLPGGRSILSVPYSQELNDKPAFEKRHMTAPEFAEMICRQFDVLWEEGAESGRVMAIALHPYLTGVPHRIRALEEALAYVCKHDGVWRATGSEIAAAYAEAFPFTEVEAA